VFAEAVRTDRTAPWHPRQYAAGLLLIDHITGMVITAWSSLHGHHRMIVYDHGYHRMIMHDHHRMQRLATCGSGCGLRGHGAAACAPLIRRCHGHDLNTARYPQQVDRGRQAGSKQS
jgi:hypothetical protein